MGQEEPSAGVRAPAPAMARDAMWVEKYRPKTLDDVAAHKDIVGTSASICGGCYVGCLVW